MEKYNIETIEREMNDLQARQAVADNLVKCGIPKGMTKHWTAPAPESGYSMGEIVEIYCNNTRIQRIDHTQEYAKSCKWNAKHGYIRIEFSKKDLREMLTLMKTRELAYASRLVELDKKVAAYKAEVDYVLAHIVKERSEMKKMPTWISGNF